MALALGGTLLPTLLYAALGRAGLGGLEHDGQTTGSLLDSLYFSIVTEATLGYGDLSPVGWSRLVACLQVMFGLVVAGLGLAKITAAQGRSARLAVDRSQGTWIEPCCLEDGTVIVTVSTIKMTDTGLSYEGDNYSGDGRFVGGFKSRLTSHTDNMLQFHYTTSGSSQRYFQEGEAYLNFKAHPKTGLWVRYVATIHDFGTLRKTLIEGTRATEQQIDVLFGTDNVAIRRLVSELAEDVKPSPSSPLLDPEEPAG